MMNGRVRILTIVFLLSGCATSYHRMGFTGGFADERTGENSFQVSFSGNGRTYTAQAADFAMLRAAEVTLQNGYSFFSVEDKEELLEVSTQFPKPVVKLKILCFIERPQKEGVYEAKEVLSSLKHKYGISK